MIERLDGPSGKNARNLRDVSLSVSAVHAERMQLHEFAAVVFIQAFVLGTQSGSLPWLNTCGLRGWTNACPVIQVVEHGWRLGHSRQKVAELAQRVGSDRVTLIAGDEILVLVFINEDVEMVEPEIRHHLLELPFTVHGAQHFGLL